MIEGPRINLRPVVPNDYAALYAIESDPTTAQTWRYRGALPTRERYEAALWQQTQQIMVVELRRTGEVIGYLQLHETELRAGHGWFSLYSGPAHRGSGLVMEGLMAFCEWVFANWPLRWIYAHSLEQNVHAFDSGIRRGHAVHLGTMHERVVIDDVPSDVHVIGISRESWLASPLRARFNVLRTRRT